MNNAMRSLTEQTIRRREVRLRELTALRGLSDEQRAERFALTQEVATLRRSLADDD